MNLYDKLTAAAADGNDDDDDDDNEGERGGGPATSHLPVSDRLSQKPPRLFGCRRPGTHARRRRRRLTDGQRRCREIQT